MTDDQKELLKKFNPQQQGEFILIERHDPEKMITTGLHARGDRDPELRIVGIHGLGGDAIGVLKELGIENVTIAFGSSEGKYYERYPAGEFFICQNIPREQFGEAANASGKTYVVMMKFKA